MDVRNWISRAAIFAVICFVGAPGSAGAVTDNGTLTVGGTPPFTCLLTVTFIAGYASFSPGPIGSYSPATLTGGKTVAGIFDGFGCLGGVQLFISGFSSNPGSSWLTSVTCNGVTKSAASVVSYGYDTSAGRAGWVWSNPSGTFGFATMPPGTPVSCSITHN